MNERCDRWYAMLDDFLSGKLDAAAETFFLGHAAGCDRCREALMLVSADLPELGDPDGLDADELTGAVLAATSGPTCIRAESLLAMRPDGSLTEREAGLLEDHLAHCAPCSELASTLAWVMPAVSELAEPELDPAFTYDVLRATAAARARKRSGHLGRLGDRWQAWWTGQVGRPQFVWEAAFAATVALVLLFGTPLSPARETPAKALRVVRAGPDWLMERADQVLDAAGGLAADLSHDIGERRNRTAPDRSDLKRHGQALGSSLLRADFDEASTASRSMREDVKKMWENWRGCRPGSLEPPE
ncbi:zf-HC2 domain-containing protein [bacterium]|nr:zf-HC2 domain-containing protein [bacterium]MBU1676688.1 zf-HC2 domain-containing protein [bacterium]